MVVTHFVTHLADCRGKTGPNFDDYYSVDIIDLLASYTSNPGGNVYKGSFNFYNRWLSIDDIMTGDHTCYSNRGMLWRKSTLNGTDFTPYFHTYGRTWVSDKMLFDLSSDSVSRSYTAGDVVESEIEFIMPAKATTDYWGLDSEFSGRLASYTNAWEAVFDEYRYNDLSPMVHTGTLVKKYPVKIDAANGDVLADFTINSGGIGHVPVVIKNVPKGTPVSVQRYVGSSWLWLESVDITGNDYYQGCQNADGKMDYVFNINRPSTNLNESWRIRILKGTNGNPTTETDPPTPNPATFATTPEADSGTAVSMTATTGSDASGTVEYYFDETSGNPGGTDSDWQSSPSYTDSDLNPASQYTYTVTIRDIYDNMGTASDPVSVTTPAGLEELQTLAVEWLQTSSAYATLWDLDFSSDIIASGEFTDRDSSTSEYNYTDTAGMLHVTAPSIFDSVDKYYLESDTIVTLSATADDTTGVAIWQDYLVNDSQWFVCWIRVMVDASDSTKQVVEFLKGAVDWGTFDTQGNQEAVYVYDFPAGSVLTATGTYSVDKAANTVSFDWEVTDGMTSQSGSDVACEPLGHGGNTPWGVTLWARGTGYYDDFSYQRFETIELLSDFNDDGEVDLEDLARIASSWIAD